MSGPKLGYQEKKCKQNKRKSHKDNADGIAVEREFSVAKCSYGWD